jgi:hypothetical protein
MIDVRSNGFALNLTSKLGTMASHKMLKEAFSDNALGQTQTYKWFKHFKNGWMLGDDEECS